MNDEEFKKRMADAQRADEIKRYHAYPLLVEALHRTILAFAEIDPNKRDYENVGRATNLLFILGERKE